MRRTIFFPQFVVLAFIATLLAPVTASAQLVPVRNDVPKVGQQEVIMMRHAYLNEGSYAYWYEQSAQKVWPWFERLGARIVGDFEIIYPEGDDATPGQDEALRFARYASYEHWQATRPNAGSGSTGGSLRLAGNGALFNANNDGLSSRRQVSQGSRGGYFLMGYMAETRPIYMPGLGEQYELTESRPTAADAAIAARLDRAQPGDEILTLEYLRITKGTFEEYSAVTRNRIWPYLEKLGGRAVGQWRVVYLPNSQAVENEDYDEVYNLTRYASYDHYRALRDNAVSMGGNGPDYEDVLEAAQQLQAMTRSRSTEFLRGSPFGSPPVYTPAMRETYRLID
ncbi:MAG: hypothetical protein O2971_14685 [Proteobacteria bacterium]|nr:hypothetical protein [Pseudomonadota bacterium]